MSIAQSSELVDVYLLHFSQPISEAHTCQHYLGSAIDLAARLRQHRTQPDARLLQVAKERNIDFTLARVWTNVPRTLERKLKDQKQGPRLCPICHGQIQTDWSLADVPEVAF